jgi:predicted ATPase
VTDLPSPNPNPTPSPGPAPSLSVARYILTGAPGSGKTTILRHLPIGIRHAAEPAREILAEQRCARGRGTPDQDPALFLDLLLRRSIEKYAQAEASRTPVLYDRGIPDCVGYAVHLGVDPAPGIMAAATYRYHPKVLVLEPWEEIYTTDEERKMSFAQALEFHEALLDGYRKAGYALIPVPRDSIEGRAAFIRKFISR